MSSSLLSSVPGSPESRLTARILRRPSHLALTGIEIVIDLRDEPHRSNESKRPDVSVREGFVQADSGGEDRTAFGDDVVDENKLRGLERKPHGAGIPGDCKRRIVLADSWTIGVESRSGLSNREAPLDTWPN